MATNLTGAAPGPGAEQPLAITSISETLGPTSEDVSTSILLVDDDESSLSALSVVLEPLGQRLLTARSGEDALRALLHEDVAVILLDMRMPGLDGLETAAYINARSRTRHIPIIFLTAHSADVELVTHAYASGAVDYVVKPFDPDVLRSKVRVFVELQRERSERVHQAKARAEAEAVASTVSKLQSVSDAALTHLEIQDLLPDIVDRATGVFRADSGGLFLRDDSTGEMTLATSRGLAPASQSLSLSADAGLLRSVLDGPPLSLPELDQSDDLLGVLAASGLRSLIAARLSNGAEPLGILFLGSRDARRFSDDDMTVLALSAERAAVAIDHARSYERERGLVEALQRRLLPDRLPEAPGLALAARYIPSERAANVGGDWYDVMVLPNGHVGLVIGDVVGHGVAAATLMGELRAALRAYAVIDQESPARVLARLNSLVASTYRAMVATVLYMVLDVDASRLRFATAGHLPPLLMGADGSTRFLERASAAPLGASEQTLFEDREAEPTPGATLLLYTDGLVERRGESIDVGLERLREALRTAPAELERLCSHILSRAARGPSTEDDVALLAVRWVHEASESFELTLPAEPGSVPVARYRFERWLGQTGRPEDAFEIKLALSEACTNAVQHAYGPARGRTFRVRAERSSDQVAIEVSDEGRWRQPRGSRGGRGLGIIKKVMDDVDVEQSSDGTTVRMRRRHGQRR